MSTNQPKPDVECPTCNGRGTVNAERAEVIRHHNRWLLSDEFPGGQLGEGLRRIELELAREAAEREAIWQLAQTASPSNEQPRR